jgi:hypothetical protein
LLDSKTPGLKTTRPIAWSEAATAVPDVINTQLVGTFPSIVEDERGRSCAFFIRLSERDPDALPASGPVKCMLRPQFVKTPHGPIVVSFCMASPESGEWDPFISETALFPRLATIPTHRQILDLLLSLDSAYFVVCDDSGKCILNKKAQILEIWKEELASKVNEFDSGKQISDEKTAIMALYWYQERYNPTDKIFEITH